MHLTLVEGGTLALRINVAAKVARRRQSRRHRALVPVGMTAGEHILALRGKTPGASTIRRRFRVEKGHTLEVRLDFNADHKVTGHIGDRPVADQW